MDALVLAVGKRGDQVKLDISHGMLVAALNPGGEAAAISVAINTGEVRISRMCLRIGGASFFGLSPSQIDAVRAWLTEQGHEFTDLAAEEA